mgnify:CR=1 FL=1
MGDQNDKLQNYNKRNGVAVGDFFFSGMFLLILYRMLPPVPMLHQTLHPSQLISNSVGLPDGYNSIRNVESTTEPSVSTVKVKTESVENNVYQR